MDVVSWTVRQGGETALLRVGGNELNQKSVFTERQRGW